MDWNEGVLVVVDSNNSKGVLVYFFGDKTEKNITRNQGHTRNNLTGVLKSGG